MSGIKIAFPGLISLIIKITNGDQTSEATINFPIGKVPKSQEIIDRIAEFEKESMPDGFRLMDKRETWDSFCQDEFGQKFALPGGERFDAPSVSNQQFLEIVRDRFRSGNGLPVDRITLTREELNKVFPELLK